MPAESADQIVDMRVVRRRDIDDVHILIREHILHTLIHLRNSVLHGKIDRLRVRPIAHGVQPAPELLESLCELMPDYTAAERCPTIFDV